MLVVNGVLIDDDKAASIFLSAINTNDIESINVLKSATILPTLCSNRAENGVVIITLKKKDISKKANLSGIEAPKEVFPLVVVNDVEFSDPEVGKLLIDNINLEKVDRVVVLKDKKATKKYGEKAKNRVLLMLSGPQVLCRPSGGRVSGRGWLSALPILADLMAFIPLAPGHRGAWDVGQVSSSGLPGGDSS